MPCAQLRGLWPAPPATAPKPAVPRKETESVAGGSQDCHPPSSPSLLSITLPPTRRTWDSWRSCASRLDDSVHSCTKSFQAA